MNQPFPTGAMDGFFAKMKENKEKRAAQKEAQNKFYATLDEKLAPMMAAYVNAIMKEAAHVKSVDLPKLANHMDRCDAVREMNSEIRSCFETCDASEKIAQTIAQVGTELGCTQNWAIDPKHINGTIQYDLADDAGDDHQEEHEYDNFVMYYSCTYFQKKCDAIIAAGLAKLWKSKISGAEVTSESGFDYVEVNVQIQKDKPGW